MTDKIKQSKINSTAWAACDTFRGVVDPAQYKDYILVMLFLKYISDVWKDHYEEYRKQYGDDDERIRRKLIEDNLLDAVIGLPANFFPTTGIPVAILLFDCSREKGGVNEQRRDVLFIDASRDYESVKKQNKLTETYLDKILTAQHARKEMDKYAHVASFDEIRENDFNLNIPRYVDTFEEEEEIDIDAVQQEIDQLEKELASVRVKMAEKLAEIER